MSRTAMTSTLPCWITQKGEGGTLRITCPRCGGKAIVNAHKWYKGDGQYKGPMIGRSCTYCFFTNRIPESK